MKILVVGDQKRYEKFMPESDFAQHCTCVFCGSESDEIAVKEGRDADVIFVDAVYSLSAATIERMPALKMINSEGVAFNKIDIEAAAAKNVYVCNNKGANAAAVAEHAVFLMIACLRFGWEGNKAVRSGHQMDFKKEKMASGIKELSECKVGLIGLGDIAIETAKMLKPFGCECFYYTRHRKTVEVEQELGLTYRALDELLPLCDIISLHMPVTPETVNMADTRFFEQMKKGSWLINTARGDLVDNEALKQAIISEKLAGAALDTIHPEPVTLDNPLLKMPEEYLDRIFMSPHLGGITTGSMRRMHRHMWQNAERIANGEKPDCVVNGID